MKPCRPVTISLLGAMAIAMAGCQGYVKRTDFEAVVDELQSNNALQQQEIDELWQQMQRNLAVYAADNTRPKDGDRGDTVPLVALDEASLRATIEPSHGRGVRLHFANASIPVECRTAAKKLESAQLVNYRLVAEWPYGELGIATSRQESGAIETMPLIGLGHR